MGQVRHGSATHPLTCRRMHAFAERGAGRPSSNTAIACFDRGAEQRAWDQSQNGCKVAEASDR